MRVRTESAICYPSDEEIAMCARQLLSAMADNQMAPVGECPYWGYWDTHLDFRTSYDKPPHREWGDGKYVVRLIHDAPDTCPSGPCGEAIYLAGFGPANGATVEAIYGPKDIARIVCPPRSK